jgi:hypothetical protein
MGDALSIIATKLITDGITASYPCTYPNLDPRRWFCFRPSGVDSALSDTYVINDLDTGSNLNLPKSWLEEPTFDLVGWYQHYLNQNNLFEPRYYEAHQQLYANNDPIDPVGNSSVSTVDIDWDELPDLEPVLSEDWNDSEYLEIYEGPPGTVGDVLAERVKAVHTGCQHFPGDKPPSPSQDAGGLHLLSPARLKAYIVSMTESKDLMPIFTSSG